MYKRQVNSDGLYIPSFNKLCNLKNLNVKKNFKIFGSAHNIVELKNKQNQGCKEIVIAPIFKTKKNDSFLDVIKFNLIAKNGNYIIALGGINETNISRLRSTKSIAIASGPLKGHVFFLLKNGLEPAESFSSNLLFWKERENAFTSLPSTLFAMYAMIDESSFEDFFQI